MFCFGGLVVAAVPEYQCWTFPRRVSSCGFVLGWFGGGGGCRAEEHMPRLSVSVTTKSVVVVLLPSENELLGLPYESV